MELFLDALLDALIDGVKMLPFLYLAYLLIEWLERHHGESIEEALAGGGRWGFIPGALLGCVPQCGFSAVASNLYASRVITPGTLLAVFIATSDEAIPLLAAEPSQWVTLVLLLACKVAFAIVGGWLLDIPLRRVLPHSLYGGYRSVYRTATLFTFFPSLYDGLHTAGLSLGGLDTFMASLPLAGYGLSWVSFCLAGLILGIILSHFQPAKAVHE